MTTTNHAPLTSHDHKEVFYILNPQPKGLTTHQAGCPKQ